MMRKKKLLLRNTLLLLVVILSFASCVTNKKTTYLQVLKDQLDTLDVVRPESYLIRPGDELYIKIEPLSPDAEQFLDAGESSSSSALTQSLYLRSYDVYADSCIDYPYIGKVKVAGLTTRQVRKTMEDAMREFVLKDGKVTVKLVNKYVSVLGAVGSPGKYTIYKEGLNIFQMIAMAGDVSTYGNREMVKLIREVDGEIIVKEFDLRRNDILGSEFYYVQPNDVIYIEKMKGQFFRMENFSSFLTTVTSSLSFLLLVLSYANFK